MPKKLQVGRKTPLTLEPAILLLTWEKPLDNCPRLVKEKELQTQNCTPNQAIISASRYQNLARKQDNWLSQETLSSKCSRYPLAEASERATPEGQGDAGASRSGCFRCHCCKQWCSGLPTHDSCFRRKVLSRHVPSPCLQNMYQHRVFYPWRRCHSQDCPRLKELSQQRIHSRTL